MASDLMALPNKVSIDDAETSLPTSSISSDFFDIPSAESLESVDSGVRVVVRSTFIEIDEGPSLKSKFFRTSKTDSFLEAGEELPTTEPCYIPELVSYPTIYPDLVSKTTSAPLPRIISEADFQEAASEPRLTVRGTFIEIDQGPGIRQKFFRTSKTDSYLQADGEELPTTEPCYIPELVSYPTSYLDLVSKTTSAPLPRIVSEADFQEASSIQNPASEPLRLTVRGTFIEIDQGPGIRQKFFRTSRTDSHLQADGLDDPITQRCYTPGTLCKEALNPCYIRTNGSSSLSSRSPTPQDLLTDSKPEPLRRVAASTCGGSLPGGMIVERTTVMMRNIPNNYTRDMLLRLITGAGFAGQFDLFYLPFDFGRRSNLGYAFINFVDLGTIRQFWNAFDGFAKWTLPSSKVCALGWSSPDQGLDAHVQRYRNSPVMHPRVPDEYKPMLFSNGLRVPFPSPTKLLKQPYLPYRR